MNVETSGAWKPQTDISFWPAEAVALKNAYKVEFRQVPYEQHNGSAHSITINTAVIKPKEESTTQENKYGVIFLPGIFHTAESNLHTGTAMLEQSPQFAEFAAFDSLVDLNTTNSLYPTNYGLATEVLATGIVNYMQKSACSSFILIGHSLGGRNAPEVLAKVQEKLSQTNDAAPKNIDMLFLVEAGGVFSQNGLKLARQNGRIIPHELETLYPSPLDVVQATIQKHKATRERDFSHVVQAERLISLMQEKRVKPPYLDEAQHVALATIDAELASIVKDIDPTVMEITDVERLTSQPKVASLLKRRSSLLRPIVERVMGGTDNRNHLSHITVWTNMAFATVGRPDGIQQVLGAEKRQAVTVPTAVLFGDTDPYFPLELAKQKLVSNLVSRLRQIRDNKQKNARLFPNAPQFIEVHVASAAHALPSTDPGRFAAIIAKTVQRFGENFGVTPEDTAHPRNRLFF